MGLKFRRGSTAQQSGSLAFGEPYVNTTLGTLVVGGATGDIVLSSTGTGSTGNFGPISGSGLDITGNANIAGNVTVGGQLTIGDQTSDTVNVVASLSSSLIPQTTNVFDLGSAQKIWRDLYISTGSIKFVEGTTVVKELSLATITGLESATGSSNVAVSSINSFTGSQLTQNSDLATITGSLISSASNLTQRVAANEAVSGTFARTNSANTFTGNQTITGSLTATTTVNAASALINGYLEIKTGTDVNSVKIGRNTGGSATRTVAIGYGAGNAGGSYNVAIGDQASIQLAGSSNTVVGATTLQQTTNASSNTVVGANISNAVAIGSTNTLIGAGISLGLNSANNTILGASVSQSVLTDNIILANGSGVIKFWYNGTDNILNNNSVVSGSLTVTGSISAGGDIVAYSTSDRRHKNNIVLISDALSKVTKLNGVTWEWNDDVDAVTKQSPKTGLIAQEVQSVLPEVVTERENGFLGLDYSKMMGLLVEAIKEQQQHIDNLTIQVEELKKQKGL